MFHRALSIFDYTDLMRLINHVWRYLCSVSSLLLMAQLCFAQQYFTENKGQWNDQVEFKKYTNGAVVYLKKQAISILQYDAEQWAEVVEHPHHDKGLFKFVSNKKTVNYHHYELEFVGCNPEALIQGERVSTYYLNYFLGNDKSKWASNVRDFGLVRYHDLYPGIDLIAHGTGKGFKYDFVLRPGAKLSDIKIKYNYVDNITSHTDSLEIKTSIGSLMEHIPVSVVWEGEQEKLVKLSYVLNGNVVQFAPAAELPNSYDQLLIDPEVVFATYAGNSVDNFGFTATYDTAGSLYSGGIATSPDGDFNPDGYYPTTPGAFSRQYGGGTTFGQYNFACDITLNKYTPDGSNLVYATYLGGANNEYPHSIVVDEHDNLIVFGTTFSTNYPTSDNAFQRWNNGSSDIIITKFNNTCTGLIGSTYIGGDTRDGLNEDLTLKFFYADNFRGEVIVKDDIIYASSCTYSTDFPTVNPFQESKSGGQDGVFLSMNGDLSQMLWGSYFGGFSGDAIYSVDFDTSGMIYVSGGTRSGNLPKATAKVGTKYKGGIADGFIAKLDPNKFSLEKVAYWGTNRYDQIFSLEVDFENKIYVVGQTQGKMLVRGNVYKNENSGQFITKFDNDLDAIEWSTVFGTGDNNPDITVNAFLVDECRKIFVSGWGGNTSTKPFSSTHNLPITSDAYQKGTDGSDFYLLVLSKQAKELLYATYFGGSITDDHVDGGTSRFDKKGVIYQSVCASCPDVGDHAISDFPTTDGAYAEKNISPRCSNAAFKIAFGNLNRKPNLSDTLFSFTAFDTLSFLYFINDVDEDSLFVTFTPDADLEPHMISYPRNSKALANWARSTQITAGCDQIGDTFNIHVYVIDKGCPAALDSFADIKVTITPPPTVEPPKTFCLYFEGDNAIRLTWDAIENARYFGYTTLYRINPNGDTVKLTTYTSSGGGEYIDTEVIAPKQNNYEYFMIVTNVCGEDGRASYRVSTTKEFEFPIKPTYVVTATVTTGNNIRINWLHSTEEDFGYYDIYRKKNTPKDEFEYYASTYELYDTFYLDKNVDVDNQSYCYALVVNDNCGHKSKLSNKGCTIVLEGISEPFEHRLWWNEYEDWTAGVNEYTLSRSVDTGSLRPVVTTPFHTRSYTDTSFNYCWGGYWYRVTGYENGGYTAESQSNRIYLIQPPLLHVPNAFTPNGDNLNELWGIVPVFVKEYEVQVYNRWGEKVYDSNNVKQDWDGFYKGKQEANNVYIYKIRYTGWDRSIHHRKGTVTVVK